jgi:hypothetical protein
MGQGVLNQIGNVPVCQCIIKVRSLPPAFEQAFAPQDAQTLGHCGELLANRGHNLGDTAFAVLEQL